MALIIRERTAEIRTISILYLGGASLDQDCGQKNGDGERKYTSVNKITPTFSRLMKKVGIHAPKGTGFYALRRTAATMAARSGDPFAVQRLLGHVDLTMATRYVQDVSEQTDRVIENSRKYVLQGENVA